jgi:N-acetylmuramic acid 6-phosphate etherase
MSDPAAAPAGAGLPTTEGLDPRMETLDAWPSAAILDALWEGQMAAIAAVRPALPALAAAADAAAVRLAGGTGRLVYAGAGTSGRIGVQDGAELPPTFDWPEDRLVLLIAGGPTALLRAVENAEDRADLAEADLATHEVGAADVVIGLAASGTTPYTIACLRAARARGALTIAVANSPGAPLLAAAEHPILIETGPEAIAGSTRMKAGTAQKAVLNLFSTLVMTRLGRVWRGRMVDMVARNEKLRRRAERMLAGLTDASPEAVRAALAESGGKVKLAVLLLAGHAREEAERLLARHGGHLRAALADGERHSDG